VLVPMIISLATILCVELPGAILLSQHFGLNGIWMGYALSFSTMLLFQAGYYWFFWRGKRVVALVSPKCSAAPEGAALSLPGIGYPRLLLGFRGMIGIVKGARFHDLVVMLRRPVPKRVDRLGEGLA